MQLIDFGFGFTSIASPRRRLGCFLREMGLQVRREGSVRVRTIPRDSAGAGVERWGGGAGNLLEEEGMGATVLGRLRGGEEDCFGWR